jgi:UDP-N-acetylglucosamine--N-acetylmuramyl-(pentapeptide) pyrophosphoryl-undecaprenol N-acetylglucosamine transferase
MGGSQGASAINRLCVEAAPVLLRNRPELQILHVTGKSEFESIKEKYAALGARARVFPFLTEMELALSAATIGVSRAGASSLAEIATVALPCILVPYPTAADNHQWFNATEYARSGAGWMLEQRVLTSEKLGESLLKLLNDSAEQERLRAGLKRWQRPDAAQRIAEAMLHSSGIPCSRPQDERLRHA